MKPDIEKIKKYVCCPVCFSELTLTETALECTKCHKIYHYIDGDIPSLIADDLSKETAMGMKKWDALFSDEAFVEICEVEYEQDSLAEKTIEQILSTTNDSNKKEVFLELGCGSGTIGEHMTKRGYFFIGIDYSVSALRYLKKKLESKGVSNFLLIHTDICNLAVAHDCVDLIYGGGSLEHFKNTQQAIDHLYRVLRSGGTSYNAVPYLNLGNIVYRAQWGSIPNFPILKQLSELIHIKLLGAKHMIFGYEMQHSKHSLKKWHMKSGFKGENIKMGRFVTKVHIHLIRIPVIKKFFIYLCEHSEMFWPAIYIAATK
jgi:ubiquinone/menaquinone biosynthesis C-methylase UbiE/uncharacterized protein YbaR (Trm112 family)